MTLECGVVELIPLISLAVALAMDAFAVSVAVGIRLKTVNPRQMFRLSWHFGLFQALMPVLGWCLGVNIRSFVESFDHWIAFGLLAFVGGKMFWDAFQDEEEAGDTSDPTRSMSLVLLSVATSIDALAVGFSMSVLDVAIAFPAIVIGVTASMFTLLGMQLGSRFASTSRLSHWAEILGGLVLFFIGFHILFEHGGFGS
ncbi:manganese efflux pump MntP [Desulfoluna spongiiphila]|uniref:manganese efflux pump MntP n=1 Tax=Desulfoluna spongiiphila TaxID=419481 RepID=UPI00125831F3|nr:manganese efflux pump MntP family protein [Desulfoluna spongiiphila]VVS94765.1 putative manganese efflux pump mntp [Desulfoluna spongiiphila]